MKKAVLFAATVLLWSCTTPGQQVDKLARQFNYNKTIISGTLFEHVLYYKQGVSNHDSTLHVYIEGDGRPWLTPRKIAMDPSPSDPLMLKLMNGDKEPSLYLGRPCYFGLSASLNCRPWYWTSGRYSKEVVDSMQSALDHFLSDQPFENLVFLGHSGGGSLAMLLAKRFPRTRALVTIAGNLDTDEWVKFHDYSPLFGLNPVHSLPLPGDIMQYHLMAENDVNVPAVLTLKALTDQNDTQQIILPGYDHRCCWQQIWIELLRCVERACDLELFIQNKL